MVGRSAARNPALYTRASSGSEGFLARNGNGLVSPRSGLCLAEAEVAVPVEPQAQGLLPSSAAAWTQCLLQPETLSVALLAGSATLVLGGAGLPGLGLPLDLA